MPPKRNDVDQHLPLKPVDFLVLMTLARGDRHGYGIVTDIAEQTDGRIRLVPGNLYTVLQRLENCGLLGPTPLRAAPDLKDQRRRYFAISPLGRKVLCAEAERLRSLVDVAESMDLI